MPIPIASDHWGTSFPAPGCCSFFVLHFLPTKSVPESIIGGTYGAANRAYGPFRSTILFRFPLATSYRLIFRPDHIAQPVPDDMRAHPDRPQYPLLLAAFDRGHRHAPPAHDFRPRQKAIVYRIHWQQLYEILVYLSTCAYHFRTLRREAGVEAVLVPSVSAGFGSIHLCSFLR